MRVLRILFTALSVLFAFSVMATEPSNIVVTIEGKSYYKHMVERGQTIYSLSKVYSVSEQDIIQSNEGLTSGGLRAGEYILIPCVEAPDVSVQNPTTQFDSRRFILYEVKSGDTIYSIARKYKISVGMLESDNPDIDVESISPGQKVLIRRAERGYATSDDIERERMERTAQRDRRELQEGEHLVKAGETLYSLSRAYGITEQELMALNNLSDYSDLKAGMVIRIKSDKASADTSVGDGEESRAQRRRNRGQRVEEEGNEIVEGVDSVIVADSLYHAMNGGEVGDIALKPVEVTFPPLSRHHTLKMALLLPFHMNDKVNPFFVDFYRGVLLALEDLKTEGYDITMSVFDTQGSGERISDIVNYEDGLLDAQLIIGPVYESELHYVVGFAEQNEIPVVSPLADIETMQSPVLFQMQAESDYKYDKLADVFDGSREVVTIYANTLDAKFVGDMHALAAAAPRSELNFVFDRGSFFYRRNADGSNGEEVDIVEFMHGKTKKTFIIAAQSETEVDRILTTLSSTRASIVGRGMTYGDYVVVGNRRWMQSANIDSQTFFSNSVLFVVPYYAKRSSEAVRMLDSRYVEMFGVLPTMYTYRGYDAAMIFCRKMFTGIDATMLDEEYTPLATTYRFQLKDGHYVNSNWMRVQYNSNSTIDVK